MKTILETLGRIGGIICFSMCIANGAPPIHKVRKSGQEAARDYIESNPEFSKHLLGAFKLSSSWGSARNDAYSTISANMGRITNEGAEVILMKSPKPHSNPTMFSLSPDTKVLNMPVFVLSIDESKDFALIYFSFLRDIHILYNLTVKLRNGTIDAETTEDEFVNIYLEAHKEEVKGVVSTNMNMTKSWIKNEGIEKGSEEWKRTHEALLRREPYTLDEDEMKNVKKLFKSLHEDYLMNEVRLHGLKA